MPTGRQIHVIPSIPKNRNLISSLQITLDHCDIVYIRCYLAYDHRADSILFADERLLYRSSVECLKTTSDNARRKAELVGVADLEADVNRSEAAISVQFSYTSFCEIDQSSSTYFTLNSLASSSFVCPSFPTR